jgi:hypothetical protein
VADRPRIRVRRKREDRLPVQPANSRRPTPVDIVSATATRRDVFATTPAGFAAGRSGMN